MKVLDILLIKCSLRIDTKLVCSTSVLRLTILLILHAKDDLWSTVVSGHHVGSHHEVSAGRPCQAKVQDLQGAI